MTLAAIALAACEDHGATASQFGVLLVPVGDTVQVADGVTRIPVRITLTGDVPPQPTVALTTSDGLFPASGRKTLSLVFGRTNEQFIELQAPRTDGMVSLRAGIGLESTTQTIQFRRAIADTLLLEPKAGFIIDSTAVGQVTLVATLRRVRGTPSPGAMVAFTDIPPAGLRGIFSTALPSDSLGRVEVRYSPGLVDSLGRGPRRITACTENPTGQPVCGYTTLFIK